jgi:hypothetical protein
VSVEAQAWAFEVSGISVAQKVVLLVLANHAGHDGSNAWPAVSTIARKACLSERRVISSLRALEAHGLVERVERPGRSSVFNLRLDVRTPDGASPLTERHPCRSVTPPLTERHPTPDAPSPKPSSNHPVTVQEEGKRKRSPAFKPPTVDEVREYCRGRGNSVDPEAFVDFYTGKGWMVGKNRMKDWQASVRTWEKRDAENRKRGRQGSRETTREFAERMARYASGQPG